MGRFMNRCVTLGAALVIVVSASPAALAQATYNPVPTTGFDQDIVIETGLVDGTPGANGEFGDRQFYQDGLSTQVSPPQAPTNHKKGLLQSNTGFVSPTSGNAINFDFAPFTGNNVLKFDTSNLATKTLTITTPAGFTKVAFVFSGGSMNSPSALGPITQYQGVVPYTIHYAGGATQTGTIKAPDWGTTPAAIEGTETFLNVGRINANTSGSSLDGLKPWPFAPESDTTANRWRIFVKEVTLTSTANITSVDFGPPQQHPNGYPTILDPLATATPTNPADFDGSNTVDATDLATLLMNFGGTPPLTKAQGDANGDTNVDGSDFLFWQKTLPGFKPSVKADVVVFGMSGVPVAVTGAVPEPATTLLALFAAAGASHLRRRRAAPRPHRPWNVQ